MNSDQCRQFDADLRDRGILNNDTKAFKEWLGSLTNVEECIASELQQSSQAGEWATFERYVVAAFYRPSRAYTDVLCDVLSQQRDDVNSEDIVDALAEIRDPAAVTCLREALFWEPDWDEFRNLAVKCIWALAAIGTPDAIAAIREVADSETIEVRRAAEHELARLGR